jgi:hypothetical protein
MLRTVPAAVACAALLGRREQVLHVDAENIRQPSEGPELHRLGAEFDVPHCIRVNRCPLRKLVSRPPTLFAHLRNQAAQRMRVHRVPRYKIL